MRRPVNACWLSAGLVLAAGVVPAAAQTPRVEVAIVGALTGAVSAGDVKADLTDASGGTLTLFRTSNRITAGKGIEGLVSLRFREQLRIELGVGWATADFESRVSGDFEGVPDLTATQGLQQFTGEIALAYRFVNRGRWTVFARGGAGAFREITRDRALVDNGLAASLGGGTQFLIRQAPAGFFGRVALRAEARVLARRGGIEFGDVGTRLTPVFAAGLVVGR